MAGNGLVPKKVIATKADGSTYETTVHTRPDDAAAVQFKGVPMTPTSATPGGLDSSHHPFNEFPELRPVRIDEATDTWAVRDLEYPFYHEDVTLDEAIQTDLREHGVTVTVDDPGHPGLGGAPKVSVAGSFDSVRGYISSYLGEPDINDMTRDQLGNPDKTPPGEDRFNNEVKQYYVGQLHPDLREEGDGSDMEAIHELLRRGAPEQYERIVREVADKLGPEKVGFLSRHGYSSRPTPR